MTHTTIAYTYPVASSMHYVIGHSLFTLCVQSGLMLMPSLNVDIAVIVLFTLFLVSWFKPQLMPMCVEFTSSPCLSRFRF